MEKEKKTENAYYQMYRKYITKKITLFKMLNYFY